METSIPLAIKYRPKTLDAIVGQDVAVRILQNSFDRKNWHHAYILEGKFGSGKTSVARIMAAMENCENAPTQEPCGTCPRCKEIFEGKSIDVKEIDVASKRSIDDVRALQEDITSCPIFCHMKYIIADEAHGWTGYAADAALKMIEEPPPHVRFVLCTTEPEAFKSTIPSRCITLNFRDIAWHELHAHLGNICKQEKINVQDEALKVIARSARGSARDALQNLQTAFSYAGDEEITSEVAQKALGVISNELYYKFIQSILTIDAPNAMLMANQILQNGGNLGKVVDGLTDYLRNLQLLKIGGEDAVSYWVSSEEMAQLKHQIEMGEGIKPTLIKDMFDLLIELRRGVIVNMSANALMDNFAVGAMMAVVKHSDRNKK